MANDVKFEGKDRRLAKIEKFLAENDLGSMEECRDLCLSKGIDVEAIVKGVQPIAFENAVWAYTLGVANEYQQFVRVLLFQFLVTLVCQSRILETVNYHDARTPFSAQSLAEFRHRLSVQYQQLVVHFLHIVPVQRHLQRLAGTLLEAVVNNPVKLAQVFHKLHSKRALAVARLSPYNPSTCFSRSPP